MESLSIEEDFMPNQHPTAHNKKSAKAADSMPDKQKSAEKEVDTREEFEKIDTESEFSVIEALREPR
jgi:hypothetical protein